MAVRNQKIQEQKQRDSRENVSWVTPVPQNHQSIDDSPMPHERYPPYFPTNVSSSSPQQSVEPNLHRWHSEESVLSGHGRPHSSTYPYTQPSLRQQFAHIRETSDASDNAPPPLPARKGESRPPLPPKPMQLHYAKPTHIYHSPMQVSRSVDYMDTARQEYENYESLELKVRKPITQHRVLHVLHNPISKTLSLQRRGSLDSMMDAFEPCQNYSSSSSTESQDGSDLLSSMTATFDEKLKLLVNPKYRLDGKGRKFKLNSDSSSRSGSIASQKGPMESPTAHTQPRGSTDRSRESLLSMISNKEYSQQHGPDRDSSDRGFAGSSSSLGSGNHHRETKVGIASRIERKDMKPAISHAPVICPSETTIVNAIGNVIHRDDADIPEECSSDDEDTDMANNNSIAMEYGDVPLIQRRMSEEKKKIRRRHTVGGARDFELFKHMLADTKISDQMLNEVNARLAPEQTLSAWQRLQPRDGKEPLSLRDWLERERFRASSPELERNIMHIQTVGSRLSGSVLQTNT